MTFLVMMSPSSRHSRNGFSVPSLLISRLVDLFLPLALGVVNVPRRRAVRS